MEETHIVFILSNKIIQEVTVVSCKRVSYIIIIIMTITHSMNININLNLGQQIHHLSSFA